MRCEVCKKHYKAQALEPRAPGIPRQLQHLAMTVQTNINDPLFWASMVHGTWRAYVGTTSLRELMGLYQTFDDYAPLPACARFLPRALLTNHMMHSIQNRFHKATMMQVHWFNLFITAIPQKPASDMITGMASGAIVGAVLSENLFLPLLGMGRIAAARTSLVLLARCSARLATGYTCCYWGYLLLANGFAGVGRRLGGAFRRLRGGRGRRRQQAMIQR